MKNYLIIEKGIETIDVIHQTMLDFSEFRYVGSSKDEQSAMNTILKENPDIVFLNVDNVLENPFDFVKEINLYSPNPPAFVALSLHKTSAYDVIKMGFVDYLLKPISELEVRKSVLKFQKKNRQEINRTICLKSYKDYQYLNTSEILFLKADNNTTDFYMQDGSVIGAFKTLRTFEDVLPQNFLRIHKSYIINSNYVSRIQYGKSICTISKNNFHIPFTKTFIENVKEMNDILYQSSLLLSN
ncbi:MAG: response regulator transcription factor [Flavobacteriaceae bacterium]|nr:response regulator transcription factor [Flavobacteriaceae bacterium]